MSSSSAATTYAASATRSTIAPRILIITDHTELGRALGHHVSIVWPDAECRVHSPMVSGRLHSAFCALGYDVVLLDDRVESGRGVEWFENLMHRPQFPPVIYLARGSEQHLMDEIVRRGALECIVRERIDHRRLALALRAGVQQRRQDLALARMAGDADAVSRFGDVTILGHRFVRELAAGGNATVYLAESERAGDMVVLKVLREAQDDDDDVQLVRFLQEYELISKIRHRNVVRIHDLGIADDHAYIAMEYFPRGDLRSRITQPLPPQVALGYLSQMASALEVVHAVGVLHRDLKPGNIMLRADESLALIDFGLATQSNVKAQLTGIGEIFGTPYYMSPEQGHGQPLDERSDLYSLGVIFYEMLTHKKPFLAPTPLGVIYLHGNAPVPKLEGELGRYQPLLDHLLAKDPAQRFPSARALLQAIAELA